MLREFLELTNLYSWKITFNFRDKTAYHTKFGFFLSQITLIASLVLLGYFSIDFIYKTHPSITYSEIKFDLKKNFTTKDLIDRIQYKGDFQSEENFNLTEYDNKFFYHLVEIATVTNQTYKKYYFLLKDKVNLTKKILIKNKTKNSKEIYQYKYSGNSNVDKTLGCLMINNTKCDKIQDFIYKNNSLETFFGETTSLKLYFISHNHKKNFMEENDPKIKLIYNKSKMTLIDNMVDLNEKNKFSKVFSMISFNLNFKGNSYFYGFYYNYNILKLIDTAGIIFTFEEENISFKKNYFYSTFVRFIPNQQKNKLLYINFDTLVKKYEINYKKLQTVFAEFGGIFNSLLLIGNLIIILFRYLNFQYDMVNTIFGFDDEELNDYYYKKFSSNALKDKKVKFEEENKIEVKKQSYKFHGIERSSIFDFELMKKNNNNRNNRENLSNRSSVSNDDLLHNLNINMNKNINHINNSKDDINNNNIKINDKKNYNNEIISNNSNNIDNSKINENSKVNSNNINDIYDIDDINYMCENKINNKNNNSNNNKINNSASIPASKNLKVKKEENIDYINNNKDFVSNRENVIELNKIKEIDEIQRNKNVRRRRISIINPKEIHLTKKITEFVEKLENRKLKKKRIFRYSYFDLIMIEFCKNCHKKKDLENNQEIYSILSKKMFDTLDIVNYYNLVENFHNLRAVLFNDNQNFAFNYLRNRDHKEYSHEILEKNLEKSYDYFNYRIKEGDVDKIDKFILKNIDREYEKFLYL